MRVVDALLTRAAKSGVLAPAIKVSVGDVVFYNNDIQGMATCRNTDTGIQWSTQRGDRIVSLRTYEQPYGGKPNQKSQLVLKNHDGFFDNMDFKGDRVYVFWGAETTKGALYDKQPPYYVKDQSNSEQQGSKVTTLGFLGLTDWLAEDAAQCDYISTGTDTLYALAFKVLEATIPPFDGCKKFNIIIDNEFDGIFNTVIPGPSFRIMRGRDTRASVLARLLDLTTVKMKAGSEELIDGDDSVHFFIPTKEVTHEITLDELDHKFLVTSSYSSIFAPNDITIKNPNNESANYSGKARDLPSYEAIPTSQTQYVTGLADNAQATLLANALLQNIKSYHNGYSAKIPMLFGVDLFDRPKITTRSGKSHEGNLGSMERVYEPQKGEPRLYMNISCGKWFDPRSSWDIMGVGAGFVDTDEDNKYTSIFIPALAYTSKQGDWDYAEGGVDWVVFGMGDDTNGSWVKYKFKAPSGTYKLRFGYRTASSCGILKSYIDDSLVYTKDCYVGTSQQYDSANESVTVADSTSNWHELKMLIDGKNASSTGYVVVFGDMVLYPF